MKCFTVQDDGELKAIEVNSYEDLAEDQVYLLVDHDKKHIFIWKGRNAPVRRKFISARTAQSMRNELGLTYKVISVEQGNETKSFGSLIKGLDSGSTSGATTTTISTGESLSPEPRKSSEPQLVPKVIPDSARTMKTTVPAPQSDSSRTSATVSTTSAASTSTTPKIAPVATPRSIPEIGLPHEKEVSPSSVSNHPSSTPPSVSVESPRSGSSIAASASPPATTHPVSMSTPPPARQVQVESAASVQPVMATEVQLQPTSGVSEDLINKVTQLLEKMEKVPGMVREIVIIGDTIFSVLTEHLKLFNKEIVKLEPMEGLPDGLFPAPEYYTRLYVENGKVLFIELFKEEPVDERSEFIDEMKRSLRDLTKLGL